MKSSYSHGAVPFSVGLSLLLAILILSTSCSLKKKEPVHEPVIPYPDQKTSIFLQQQVDSSEFEWYTDVKPAASSFCNEELPDGGNVSTADITIVNETLYRARVEVSLAGKILILTMERPYKNRGKNSIWQVIKMEEKSGG